MTRSPVEILREALDNIVGPGAQHEHTCDAAEHPPTSGEGDLCIWCEARAALADTAPIPQPPEAPPRLIECIRCGHREIADEGPEGYGHCDGCGASDPIGPLFRWVP